MKTNGAYLISLKSGNGKKSALWRNHVTPDLDDRPRRGPQIRTGARLAYIFPPKSLKDDRDCQFPDMCIIHVILNKVTWRKEHSGVT